MNNLEKEIHCCEEKLLHTEFSQSPHLLEEILALEFEEVDPYGSVQTRAKVLNWLLAKDCEARWRLDGFQARMLSENLVLAQYHAQQVKPKLSTSKGSKCSSIWRRHNESWQMVFHQATKIA